jgi:hypothetical protein
MGSIWALPYSWGRARPLVPCMAGLGEVWRHVLIGMVVSDPNRSGLGQAKSP